MSAGPRRCRISARNAWPLRLRWSLDCGCDTWKGQLGFSLSHVIAGRTGRRRCRPSSLRCQHQLLGSMSQCLLQQNVRSRAVEKCLQYRCGRCRTVAAEDSLVRDPADDLHSGLPRDVAQNLVQARIICAYLEHPICVGHVRSMPLQGVGPRRCRRNRRSHRVGVRERRGWRRRQVRTGLSTRSRRCRQHDAA